MDNAEGGIKVAESGAQMEYMLVRQLASVFSRNQVAARRGLHDLLARSPSRALDALYRVMEEDSAGAGAPFVASLVAADETRLLHLVNSPTLHLQAAIRIVRRLIAVEPGLEATLLRMVVRTNDSESIVRVLSILEEASDCVRISQQLQSLIRQPDLRVRSKAARIVVRISRERDRLVQLLADPDHRVRANAAEGFFALAPKPAEIQALWQLASDEHHRPATTALAVLALCGHPLAVTKLIELLDSANERFQLAAAWAMGRVADPTFLPVLQSVIREQSGSLKRMALRSCTLIRRSNPQSGPTASPPIENQPSDPD